MAGMSTKREGTIVSDCATAAYHAGQIAFDDAIALIKKQQGAILIRTKSGTCMVRLANGNVLGVTPPTERPDNIQEGRDRAETKLRQEIDRLNKVVLINKNTLDKAYHHLRDKDIEIKQLKNRLEEKEKETTILNKVINVRGNLIEKLKSEINILNKKLENVNNYNFNSEFKETICADNID